MDAVTEILLERSQTADKVSRMVLVSIAAHAAIVAAVTLLPRQWGEAPEQAQTMTISLGGAPGPLQGKNPISEKPVQQAVPDPITAKNDAPPMLAKPEMIEPVRTATPDTKSPLKPEPSKDLPQLRGRTPTQGAEVKAGSAKVVTGGAAIPFGGLATGGGGAGAAYTDYANFCCPEYLTTMVQLVQRNWQQHQGQDGTVQVKFTIQRDGTLTNIEIEQPSTQFLNLAAQRALVTTKQLPPLPAAFTGDRLTVHLNFQFRK